MALLECAGRRAALGFKFSTLATEDLLVKPANVIPKGF